MSLMTRPPSTQQQQQQSITGQGIGDGGGGENPASAAQSTSSSVAFPQGTSTSRGTITAAGKDRSSAPTATHSIASTAMKSNEETTLPPWKPPVWLVGSTTTAAGNSHNTSMESIITHTSNSNATGVVVGGGSNTNTTRTAGGGSSSSHVRPNWTVPIPPIPPSVRQYIQDRLHAKELQQLHHLNQKLAEQKARMQTINNRMQVLQQRKDEAIEIVRQQAQEEGQKAWLELEKSLRDQYEQEKTQRQEQWRLELEQECQREHEQQEKPTGEGQERAAAAAAGVDSRIHKKRPREETMSAEQQQGEEVVKEEQNSSNLKKRAKVTLEVVGVDTKTKTDKKDDGGDKKKDDNDLQPPLSLVMQQERDALELVSTRQKELEDAKQNLDRLQERRTEIVWLLKQVIKAEEKFKAKVPPNHKPATAKMFTSKGA